MKTTTQGFCGSSLSIFAYMALNMSRFFLEALQPLKIISLLRASFKIGVNFFFFDGRNSSAVFKNRIGRKFSKFGSFKSKNAG